MKPQRPMQRPHHSRRPTSARAWMVTILAVAGAGLWGGSNPADALDFQIVHSNDFVTARVSPDGSVVVGGSASASPNSYRWEAGSFAVIVFSAATGGAQGASSLGTVVVGIDDDVAYRWEGGVQAPIPFLTGGTSNTAHDVTPDGMIIVGSSTSTAAGGNDEGFSFQGGVSTPLGDLAGGAFSSTALAVTPDGNVIVGQGTSASGSEATRWVGGVPTGLGDFAGGAFSSRATAVSEDGATVVGWGTTAAGSQAFRWRGSGLEAIGDLGSGTSRAHGVSGDGSLVVGESGSDAFVWDELHGMRDLETVLLAAGADLLGVELQQASDISADGQTIVGIGFDPEVGGQTAWIVTGVTQAVLDPTVPALPWPGAIALCVALVLGATGRRVASRR